MSAGPDAVTLPLEAERALHEAFGGEPILDLAVLKGGLSGSSLFSFTVAGSAYVLRKGDVRRAPQELACLQIASERGVAPRLRHADARTAISIMDRVPGGPLGRGSPLDPQRLHRIASTLRRLHEGPVFPRAATVAQFIRFFDGALRERGAGGLPDHLLTTVDAVAPVIARYAETAPCHNDLNPNNILVTEEQVFFVDWEMACAGDPFFDLAQLGVFAFPGPDERASLLEAYLARRPTAEEEARAVVARVMALAFYAAAFTFARAMAGGAGPAAAPVSLAELLQTLGRSRERADPALVAASLLLEMQRESESTAFDAAKGLLTRD